MTVYYIEEIKNRDLEVIGYSQIKKATSKSNVPEDGLIVKMNSIKYDDYIANPTHYYLSGTTLQKVQIDE